MKFGHVGFDHYKISCIIGTLEEERKSPQDIYVDLRVQYDFSLPAKDDAFDQAICYVSLSNICKELAQTRKYQLLETFAVELIETLMERSQIGWAFVRIKKPSAIPDADYAVVELEKGERS